MTCLCVLAFVFRDVEQLCAAESKLMCRQRVYLPLFSTFSITQLGVCVPWAALNTQQGLTSEFDYFTDFFWCLEEGSLPFLWKSKENAWSAAEGWAMSQLRGYESRLKGRPK